MLIRDIERFLGETGMAATRFGRLAAHDPRFVLDLRNGREPRAPMRRRVRAFIATFSAAAEKGA